MLVYEYIAAVAVGHEYVEIGARGRVGCDDKRIRKEKIGSVDRAAVDIVVGP